MILGLDSGILMRFLEGDTEEIARLRAEMGDGTLHISAIAIAECLIKPLREGRAGDVAMFQAFARSPKVRVVNVDLQAATHAATIRAQFNLKLPDSLHLSAAVSTSADVFLTLDADFDRCIGHLPIIIRRLNP